MAISHLLAGSPGKYMVALQNKQNIVLEGGWPGGAGDSILTTRLATEEKYFILQVILINELRIYQEY